MSNNTSFVKNNLFKIIRLIGMGVIYIGNLIMIFAYFPTLPGFGFSTKMAFTSASILLLIPIGLYAFGLFRDRKKQYSGLGVKDDIGLKIFTTVIILFMFAMLLGMIDTIIMLFFNF